MEMNNDAAERVSPPSIERPVIDCKQRIQILHILTYDYPITL